MTTTFTPITVPNFQTVLDLLKKDIFLTLYCHAIATVKSVDYEAQTLIASVNYSQTFFNIPDTNVPIPYEVPYPLLIDCPFIILGGASGALTFPISQGDECIILFNDRDIDNWTAGASSGPVNSNRLHSMSDGIALVGFPDIANYDTERVVLQNGDSKVALGSKINIQNQEQSLYTILNTLLGAIAAAVSSTGDTGIATIAAAAGAAQTAIGELLN
jgi:Phage protein Gp138 N-terminal domain